VSTEADVVRFDGIASVVDAGYLVRDIFGEYTETMAKGAFNRTLKQKADATHGTAAGSQLLLLVACLLRRGRSAKPGGVQRTLSDSPSHATRR
jgi:hypothetical protein